MYPASASIKADDVERILANVDAIVAVVAIDFVGHGCAPSIASPSQHHARQGQEHGHSISGSHRLLDHLVGDGQQRVRDHQAERLGGP
jgi:hypothetical protein